MMQRPVAFEIKHNEVALKIGQRVILVDEATKQGVYMVLEKANKYRVILVPYKEPPVQWTKQSISTPNPGGVPMLPLTPSKKGA
jgi:hypothetical protein